MVTLTSIELPSPLACSCPYQEATDIWSRFRVLIFHLKISIFCCNAVTAMHCNNLFISIHDNLNT